MPLIVKYTALRFNGPPWPWWERASQVQVCSMDPFGRSKEKGVVAGIESVATEFHLPLVAEVANEETQALAKELIEQSVSANGIIDVVNLLAELNNRRPRYPDLQDGLVITFDGSRLRLPDLPGSEQAEWGWTELDGLVFLRVVPDQPLRNVVRHEMGHLLGIGWHHPNCVMGWACTSQDFCDRCKDQINKVCRSVR
jgi:hypothetical protein